MKKPYIPPTVEIVEYRVERGFAWSSGEQDCFLGDVDNEIVGEGEGFRLFDDDSWNN